MAKLPVFGLLLCNRRGGAYLPSLYRNSTTFSCNIKLTRTRQSPTTDYRAFPGFPLYYCSHCMCSRWSREGSHWLTVSIGGLSSGMLELVKKSLTFYINISPRCCLQKRKVYKRTMVRVIHRLFFHVLFNMLPTTLFA